ncbi:MAG: DUF2155 domain-containing protein [Pseudomonadota bacterium]
MRWLAVVLALSVCGAATAQDNEQRAEDDQGTGGIQFKKAPFRTGVTQRPLILPEIETEARAGARLRKLDKMTGSTETVEIEAGGTRDLGRLRVALAVCEAPEDDARKGTRAHLTVWDMKTPAEPAFAGWMFADSPALSALDHPRFDLWVIACTTS